MKKLLKMYHQELIKKDKLFKITGYQVLALSVIQLSIIIWIIASI